MVGRVGSRALVGLLLVAGLLSAPLVAGAREGDSREGRGRSGGRSGVVADAAPPHDDFDAAIDLPGGSGMVPGSNEGATLEPDEPLLFPDYDLGASVWYTWTAPDDGEATFSTQGSAFDTVLAVHTGGALADLVLVAENDQAGPDVDTSLLTFAAEEGTTYRIQLAGYEGEQSGYELEWRLDGFAPANDDFGGRALGQPNGSFLGTTDDATQQTGEPDHGGATAEHSVWFSWFAPLDGQVTFGAASGDFTPVVDAYSGSAVDALTPLAEGGATVELEVVAGEIYAIVVDGTAGGSGPFELTWTTVPDPPANDDFDDAQALAPPSGYVIAHNFGASLEVDEPQHAGESGGHSVWFSLTPTVGGPLELNTFDSDFDTLLAVYTGSEVGALTEVASNDQMFGDQSRVRFSVVAGTTYRIAVDGYADGEGLIGLEYGPFTSPFSDVSAGHPFFTEILWMDEMHISTGYEDGTYRPAAAVTRQAMSAFLFRLAGEPGFPPPPAPSFSDVPFDHVFAEEIYWMDEAGIATGYDDGTFRPGAVVTRQAMSAFMHRYATLDPFDPPPTPTFTDVGTGHPFYEHIEWMAEEGISNGYDDNTYRPAAVVTRQAMSAFLFRLWEHCTCPV
jgi:hypothetical protein